MTDLQNKKILVIDDNMTNLAILKSQLELWKLIPILADSAEGGLDILSKDNQIDLVLTDMQMPYMDGIELAKNVKKAIPIHFLLSCLVLLARITVKTIQLFHSILNKPVRQHVLSRHILDALQPQNNSLSGEKNIQQKIAWKFFRKVSFGNFSCRR